MEKELFYDVIVCGGGTSGIVSAISASRNGCKVLIVEETGLLGGTNVLSLVTPFMSYHYENKQVIKGIAEEIVERLQEKNLSLGHINDPLGFASTITPVDIEGLKALYFELIEKEKIDVLFHSFIIDVIKDNNIIKGIKVASKSGIIDIKGKVVIDATGDGDVCKYAGCKYVLGREKDNLCQPMTMLFTLGNCNLNKVRENMYKDPSNFVLRDGYDFNYVGVSGYFKEVDKAIKDNCFSLNRDRVLFFEDVKHNEVTVNMTRVQKQNGTDAFALSKAEIEGRKQIGEAYNFIKKYIPGFENSYIVRTPERIGVRETRHIQTEYIMGYNDVAGQKVFDDSIAIGAFPMDIHSPDSSKLEGTSTCQNVCYEIPLRCIKVKEVHNLIVVGRAVGATHEASASMRLSPIAMSLGEAGGVLASISVKKNIYVNKVNYQEVQDKLVKQGQVIKK